MDFWDILMFKFHVIKNVPLILLKIQAVNEHYYCSKMKVIIQFRTLK